MRHIQTLCLGLLIMAMAGSLNASNARAADELQPQLESAPQEEDSSAHRPHLYNIHGNPVDPLCFLKDIGTEDETAYATDNCESKDLHVTGASPLDPSRFVSVAYETTFSSPNGKEQFTSPGFTGYRVHGTIETDEGEYEAVTVVENGGGSGVFTTLMLLETARDDEAQVMTFYQKEIIAAGDRCNGGIKDAKVESGNLTYDINMTMYDLLFFQGEPEDPALNADAVAEIPSCAICCYATGRFDRGGLLMVSFEPEDMHPGADDGAASCVNDVMEENIQNGRTQFTPEEYAILMGDIEQSCLGRAEESESDEHYEAPDKIEDISDDEIEEESAIDDNSADETLE